MTQGFWSKAAKSLSVRFTHFEKSIFSKWQPIKLTSIYLPSTIITIGKGVWNGHESQPLFPKVLESVTLSRNLTSIGDDSLVDLQVLRYLYTSMCKKLKQIKIDAFFYCYSIMTLDLSECSSLEKIISQAFSETNSLTAIVLPSSLKTIGARAFNGYIPGKVGPLLSCLRTVIWKGRTSRLAIHSNMNALASDPGLSPVAFSSKPLDQLVAEGTITEIFIP